MRIPFFGPKPPPTISEQLVAKLDHLKEERARKILETVDMLAGYVDPNERNLGPDGELWLPLGGRTEGRSTTDRSNFTSERELTAARDDCRLLASTNEFAINLHENMESYILGSEQKNTIVAKDGEDVGEDKIKQVQTALDEWTYSTKWSEHRSESLRRYDRDGEFFRRFFQNDAGDVEVRFVEPNHVTQPDKAEAKDDLFGVRTANGDTQTHVGYWINGALVDVAEVQHVRANVDANVRRGMPTTWPIRKQLRQAVAIHDNIAATTQIQTSIALIVRTIGATATGLSNQRALAADVTRTNPTTGKTEYLEKGGKGRVVRANANTEYDFPAAGLNVTEYSAGVDAILRGAAARVCFPEFMFTSNASNANYASTMVAEGPAVRFFQRRQHKQKCADLVVLWRVLENLAERGIIPADVLDKIEIQIEAPSVQVRDTYQEAQTHEIYDRMGVMSKQTIATRAGLDWSQEEKNIEEYEKKHPAPEPILSPFGGGAGLTKYQSEDVKARRAAWRGYPLGE